MPTDPPTRPNNYFIDAESAEETARLMHQDRLITKGMDGVFSVAGRITTEGMLSLVMVGEYQTAGKPLCTQSWNLAGLRARSDRPAADKPDKKK